MMINNKFRIALINVKTMTGADFKSDHVKLFGQTKVKS